tara:strand:- start:1119 stop:2144 length:1026 start_codon:yes stop_codon:yes gene_type:complete
MRLLFFFTKPYSVSILEPIEIYCKSLSELEVAWYKAGSAKHMDIDGLVLNNSEEVLDFKPDAIIVPGNIVPDFWPGIKVQIFHGLCEEKKGHYDITGFFDLYCTPGPQMTEKFQDLQKKYKTFLVRETGWPKLDRFISKRTILDEKKLQCIDPSRKTILYAPTFSPKYQSSEALFESIKKAQKYEFNWLVKFHDLEKISTIQKYKTLVSDFFHIIDDDDILQGMKVADILLSDTSSVVYEFLLFDRPIITFNAITRIEKGINIINPDDIAGAITRSIEDPNEFNQSRKEILNDIHPYTDGESSKRVIDTILEIINGKELEKLRSKPINWYRKRQIRKLVNS